MQIQIEEVSPVEKKLIVEVPWSSIHNKLGASYRGLAKQVNLKGFRKGKVPRSVLERMYSERVHAEVANELVRESFISAISDHKIDAVTEPRIDKKIEISIGQPLAFEAVIEVKGDVVVKDFKGMELSKRPIKIGEDDVTNELLSLQKEHMELVPIDGRTELTTDDMVTISVTGTIGDDKIDRPSIILDLGNDEHEPLPGLHAGLRGLAIDTTDHSLTLMIPEDHSEPRVAGKTAAFVISVVEAKKKSLPPLDDDFARDTGKSDTLEGLKASIRTSIEERQVEEVQVELNRAAVSELVKRNPIPVASSLVERVVQDRFQRLQQMMGVQPGASGRSLDDETRKTLSEGADDEVRGQLLLDALAESEKVEASEEDIDARVADLAQRSGKSAGALKTELVRGGRLENIAFQIKQDKAVALLIANATVEIKEPEPEVSVESSEHSPR